MTKTQQRKIAVLVTWSHIESKNLNPATADNPHIERALVDYTLQHKGGQADDFYRNCSDNQWRLFLREFKAKQKQEQAWQAMEERRQRRQRLGYHLQGVK